jgi:hypothetical protein
MRETRTTGFYKGSPSLVTSGMSEREISHHHENVANKKAYKKSAKSKKESKKNKD